MWLLILAIIALVLFARYFIKIDIKSSGKQKNTDNTSNQSLPTSVAIATYEQNKAFFFSFAQFFLTYKRPYVYKSDIETFSNTRGSISGGVDRGNQGAGSSQGCNTICINDPTCNAWQYSEGECKKYTISQPGHITITDLNGTSGQGNSIGYIFRPQSDTSWAVSDVSGLPTNHDVFKAIANTVLKLDCRDTSLLRRASTVSASVSVKYCYETEVTRGGIPDEYIAEKNKAFKNLEDVARFFIFTGDSGEYPNKTEFSLSFAILVDVMRDNLYNTNSHLKNAILQAVDELKVFSAEYNITKDFFNNELDKNSNSTIDRQELTDLYREITRAGDSWSANIIDSQFSINTSDCVNENGISDLVERFFDKYDLNQNGHVTLQEILSSTLIPTPTYLLSQDCTTYNDATDNNTSTTASSTSAVDDDTGTNTGGSESSDSECSQDGRTGGTKHNNTCYYEYSGANTCGEIDKWKKCDATRGDKSHDRASGRYVMSGDTKIFCTWSGTKSSGECVNENDTGSNSGGNSGGSSDSNSDSNSGGNSGGGADDTAAADGSPCKEHEYDKGDGDAGNGLKEGVFGGNADKPLECKNVNWVAQNHRIRHGVKGADTGDGYGGAKYACENMREVSNDGLRQRGCTWNLDESDVDSGDGRGMRDWLEDNILKNKGIDKDDKNDEQARKEALRLDGPCQPGDICPRNLKLKGGDNRDSSVIP